MMPTERSALLNFFYEKDRIKSFDNWPFEYISIQRLAAAGFYYLNRSDTVRCHWCNIELSQWQPLDNPIIEHKKWSPKCRYIHGVLSGIKPSDPGFDVCGYHGIEIHKSTQQERKIPWYVKIVELLFQRLK